MTLKREILSHQEWQGREAVPSSLVLAMQQAPIALALTNLDGVITYVNDALLEIWQSRREHLLGRPLNQSLDAPGINATLVSAMAGGDAWHGDMSVQRPDGVPLIVKVTARCIRTDEGTPLGFVLSITDITQYRREEKRDHRRQERQRRMYAALSRVVETVIRAESPESLFHDICHIAVDEGGVKKAWAGFIDEATQEIRPLAHAGIDDDVVSRLVLSLDPSSPNGRSPAAMAARDDAPCVINDFQTNPRTQLWWDAARKDQVYSGAAFPLRRGTKVIGVIAFYGGVAHLFPEEMVDLLERVANDISYALEKLELDERHQALQASLEAQVLQRTAELNAAMRELEAFSYSVAHDLRAPLRAIDGFSVLAMEEGSGQLSETGISHLERVRENTKRMGLLMDALLDLSRVSRKKMCLTHFNLADIARLVVEQLRLESPDRDVIVTVPESIWVEADESLALIVMGNLLGNAWKYSSKRSRAHIELGTLDQDGVPVYFVRDDGAGFDMKYSGKLFSAFERLHHANDFKGTGIGLATVKRIIQRHGGQVWAEGETGEGATFYFTLADVVMYPDE